MVDEALSRQVVAKGRVIYKLVLWSQLSANFEQVLLGAHVGPGSCFNAQGWEGQSKIKALNCRITQVPQHSNLAFH